MHCPINSFKHEVCIHIESKTLYLSDCKATAASTAENVIKNHFITCSDKIFRCNPSAQV